MVSAAVVIGAPGTPLDAQLVELRRTIDQTLDDLARTRRTTDHVSLLERAQQQLDQRARLVRRGGDLFADPAWTMMLYIFVRRDRELIPISAACHASGVAYTTGLRWLERLEGANIFNRSPHPTDGRSWSVDLTAHGLALVSEGLSPAAR